MKSKFWTIVAVVMAMNIVIITHELGHYAAGKHFGLHVEKFSVGIGPGATLFETGETKWTFGIIPVMGAVHFYYDNPEKDDVVEFAGVELQGKLFNELTPVEQLIVHSAGILVNILSAIAVLLVMAVSSKRRSTFELFRTGIKAFIDVLVFVFISVFTLSRYPAKKEVWTHFHMPEEYKGHTSSDQITSDYVNELVEEGDAEVGQKQIGFSALAFLMLVLMFGFLLGFGNLLPVPGFDGYYILTMLLGYDYAEAVAALPDQIMSYLLIGTGLHLLASILIKTRVIESHNDVVIPREWIDSWVSRKEMA